MKADKSKWVQKIHDHAMARYENGWDWIIECYPQEDVLELLDETVSTYAQAIKELGEYVKLNKEQESNVSWGEW